MQLQSLITPPRPHHNIFWRGMPNETILKGLRLVVYRLPSTHPTLNCASSSPSAITEPTSHQAMRMWQPLMHKLLHVHATASSAPVAKLVSAGQLGSWEERRGSDGGIRKCLRQESGIPTQNVMGEHLSDHIHACVSRRWPHDF